jgi:glycosyltransferase involved in cell wall biosynthesis
MVTRLDTRRHFPMKIGLIAPPWVPVPPPAYGGTEVVIDNLARGLHKLGHDVRLFTVGESQCPVPTEYLYAEPVTPIGVTTEETAHVLAAYEALADVDVIHDHTTIGPLIASMKCMRTPPVVTTHHGPFSAEYSAIYSKIARNASIVAISYSQAKSSGGIPVAAVIHHGIDLEVYRPGPGDGGYLMFIGRMSPHKGVHHAVRVAKKAGRRLVLATKMREQTEVDYFTQEVKPLLDPDDELPQEMPLGQRLSLLRGAAALLNPITWREPFGLVMAEALASATPVLAFANGAAPEIIDPGQTGYLCSDEEEMIAAVDRVPEINRADCRDAAQKRFSLLRMARDHERFYRRVLDSQAGFVRRIPEPGRRLVSA